jgi:hypothetical protein
LFKKTRTTESVFLKTAHFGFTVYNKRVVRFDNEQNRGVWWSMLPIFVTNRTDHYLFQLSSVIWFVPEFVSSLTQNRDRNPETYDRASGFVLMICIFGGIFLDLQTAFSAHQFAIPWQRSLINGAAGAGYRFRSAYREHMQHTKRFIPFLF